MMTHAGLQPSRRTCRALPILLILMFGLFYGAAAALAASANLDHCANGAFDDPADPTPCAATDWQNGSLNQQQAHYLEGDSVPYRVVFSDLTVGETYTLTIEWDSTVSSGKHALDYLTRFDRTESGADPCSDVALATGLNCSDIDTAPIPLDPNVQAGPDGTLGTADDITQVSGDFTLYGGTLTGLSPAYTLSGDFSGASETAITVTFTADDSSNSVVLAWGGHISRRLDWGEENSAVSISGSSYHMRLTAFTCSNDAGCGVGQQDRSLSNQAVIFPGIITLIKESTTGTTDLFDFDISGPNSFQQNVSLAGNGGSITIDGLLDFGAYDITELLPPDTVYEVMNIVCDDATGGTSTDPNLQRASVDLAEGDIVTCTFTNKVISQPSITLTKLADPTTLFEPGGPVTYTVEVMNTGNVPVTLTSLVDVLDHVETDLLGAQGCDPQPPASIEVGETYSCTFQMDVAGIGGYAETDTVTAVAVDAEGKEARAENSATVMLIPFNPAIQVVKTASPSSGAVVGDTITYDYTVTNTGDVTLSNVSLEDDKLGTVTLSDNAADGVTELAPGDSESGQAEHVVTQADIDAGWLTNTATAQGIDPKGGEVFATDDATVTFPQDAAIDLAKTASPSSGVKVGQVVTYAYTVTNTGTVSLSGITLFDDVEGPITLSTTTLAPGESFTVQATHLVTQPEVDNGSLTNTATATGTGSNQSEVSDQASATVTFAQNPAIQVVKEAAEGDLHVGSLITYRYTVTNTGDVTLSNITLNDDKLGVITLSATTLAPGVSTSGSATHTVTQSDLDRGTLSNVATASGTTPSGVTVTDEDSVTVAFLQSPLIDIEKRVANTDHDGSGDITLSDSLTYSFEVTNTGNVTLTNVDVQDILAGLSAIDCAGVTILAPGASMTCTATYTVSQADVDAGRIINTATATGSAPNGEQVSDRDTLTTTVPQRPGIDLVKTPDWQEVPYGTEVAFTVTVTNTGNVTLSGVQVSDPVAPGCGGPIATLAVGASQSFDCTAIATEDFTNVATATVSYIDGASGFAEDDAQVHVLLADLQLTKAGTDVINLQETNLDINEVVYTITVTNVGELTAQDATVNDPLPTDFTYDRYEISKAGAACSYDRREHAIDCKLGDMAVGDAVTITLYGSTNMVFGQLYNRACTATASHEKTLANNCGGHGTWVAPGFTHTQGFWSTHPNFLAQCLERNGILTPDATAGESLADPQFHSGVLDLGATVIGNEWGNGIDGQKIDANIAGKFYRTDWQPRSALEYAIGTMRGGIAKKSDGSKWSKLNHVRKQVLQQLMPYICNTTLLGSRNVLPLDEIIADLYNAKRPQDIRQWITILTLYNESGVNAGLDFTGSFQTGPADPSHPWDDSMDDTD